MHIRPQHNPRPTNHRIPHINNQTPRLRPDPFPLPFGAENLQPTQNIREQSDAPKVRMPVIPSPFDSLQYLWFPAHTA